MSREKAVKENETSIAGPASGRGNIVKKGSLEFGFNCS